MSVLRFTLAPFGVGRFIYPSCYPDGFGVPVPSISLLLNIARVAFCAALIFTSYSAVAPSAHVLHLTPWDKSTHFIAFYVLTGLAVTAFPRQNLFVVAALLSAFGALIEVVQGLPVVHRDRDFWDWVADTLAIASALAPLLLGWWRAQIRSGQKYIDTKT